MLTPFTEIEGKVHLDEQNPSPRAGGGLPS